jgi:4a-hydroxytetrahydrobiopterin dehydratase
MTGDPRGWKRKKQALVRTHKFPSFVDAIGFVQKLAFYAEREDHHPDLAISYRTVTITWTTHDEGGVTAKDIAAARFTNTLIR